MIPVFVIDDALLTGRLSAPNRAWFMRGSLVALSASLAERGAALRILRGRAQDVLPPFARESGARDLFLTRDAAPYGRRRDREAAARLAAEGIEVHAVRGLYVHEPDEVRHARRSPLHRLRPVSPGLGGAPPTDRAAGAGPDPRAAGRVPATRSRTSACRPPTRP